MLILAEGDVTVFDDISTGDLNPIYNVPMLGIHKATFPNP